MSAVSCRFFQVTYGDIDKKVCTVLVERVVTGAMIICATWSVQ